MGTVDNPLVFPLFWGTALSISALPVIARVLMELNLFRTDMGMIVMPAAVVQDVLGWCVFAVVLSMMGINQTFSIGETIAYTLAFSAFAIVVLRRAFDRVIPWISAHWDSPGAIIGIGVAVALIAAAFTEWIGIHGLFGAFFVGIALGDSRHLNERTRFAFHQFISYFFAPLFFASIGLQVDFGRHFDIVLVLTVLGIATFGKLAGSLVGCRLAGISRRDAIAIGFAMNARGAMEIILGLVALQYGILSEKPFVALVVMALFTSLASGPIIKRVLRLKRLPILTDFMSGRTFLRFDEPTMSRMEIIQRMVEAIGTTPRTRIDADTVARLVLEREELMHTGIGDGIAIPHARIPGIDKPRIAIGITRDGVDFDAPDGKPARIVILLLTPVEDTNLPLEIFAEIARTFSSDDTRLRVFQAMNFTELKAVVKHAAGAARRQKGLKWPL
jgi:mannitol/fructose-specific phosphotransferase system IIA component (Ntr-type)